MKKEKHGTKYGQLTVIREHPERIARYIAWVCLCDCGNITVVSGNHLRSGNTKSCGCLRGSSKKDDGHRSAFNRLYSRYKGRAKERGMPFELSKDEFRNLVVQPCYYCGEEPSQVAKRNKSRFLYSGVDRVNSSKGYIADNCVACCIRCNRKKGAISEDAVIYKIIAGIINFKGREQ